MKKLGIIIISLLICETSYAGYITIEKEKIIIGDGTRVIGELPIQKRVEVVGETKNRYIIKYNSHLAGIDKKCLRFPKDEQPYIYPYVGMSEQIYEVTLELYKGEEYKVIKEDKTRYLIEYTFKDTPIGIWVEKNLVYYNASSKLDGLVKYQGRWITAEEKFELEQEAKGLVKYQNKWVTPEEKFELEQRAKGLVKYQEGEWITPEEFSRREKEKIKRLSDEFKTHKKILNEYILNLAGFRGDSSKLTKSEILQKYGDDFEFRTLLAIDNELEYCLKHLAQTGEYGSTEYYALLEINKKYKNTGIGEIKKERFDQWAKTLTPKQPQFIFFVDSSFTMGAEEKNIEIQKGEFETHIKLFDKYMLTFERFRGDSSRLSKNKLLQKYGVDFEFKTLTAIDNEFEYWLEYIKQAGMITEEYSFLIEMGKKYKKELEQWVKGLVKYRNKWVTPEKKFELEQRARGLVKYQEGEWITPEELSRREKEKIKRLSDEFNNHRKILDAYILNLTVFRSDSSRLAKSEILQKYGDDFEFKTLVAIDNEIKYCLNHLEQMGECGSTEYYALSEINKKNKEEMGQSTKGLVKYKDKWMAPEEKYELEQEGKGLVKEEKVLYRNKWVTPEEKKRLEEEWKRQYDSEIETAKQNRLNREIERCLEEGKVCIGMTKKQVGTVCGKPNEIESFVWENGMGERWIYTVGGTISTTTFAADGIFKIVNSRKYNVYLSKHRSTPIKVILTVSFFKDKVIGVDYK